MTSSMFVNLPVKNLKKSVEFFTRLGFKFDPQFTDDTAASMIVSEGSCVMLMTEHKFRSFTPKHICDTARSVEVLLCITVEQREKVDEMVRRASAAGGKINMEPQDHEFMYSHGFRDLDGHTWEVMYLDLGAIRHREAAAAH
jgi:uncharacterized protein